MFGYLNIYSDYSLLKGVVKIPKLIKFAKENNCDAVAITDINNLYSAIDFIKEAKKNDILPVIGVTIYLKEKNETTRTPLILLAKNLNGYKNLIKLITFINFSKENHTIGRDLPFTNFSDIKEMSEDLVAVLPALNNHIRNFLAQRNDDLAKSYLDKYKNIFSDDLYIGISPQNANEKDSIKKFDSHEETEKIVAFANKNNLKTIPLPLIYLTEEKELEARDVVSRVQPLRLSNKELNFFEDKLIMPSRKNIENWVKEIDKTSLENLDKLLKEITAWELELGKWIFPTPPDIPKNVTPESILNKFVEDGLKNKGMTKTKEIQERIDFELGVINEKGYAKYFVTVIQLIEFMHKKDILTTTRGSAAGSLVSYLTGITNIDPIEYQIAFERFLNPHRPSPPDIDLDISDERRDEVIKHITQKFGKEKVAQIGTFGKMMARSAVRDTARALGYSYISGDKIARLIPLGKQGFPMFIDTALEESPQLKDLYKNEEVARHIIDVAKLIEGNARHISVHAAGVVIADTEITDYTPIEPDAKNETDQNVTQYNMHSIEDAGLLKFDILGLTYLSILGNAVKNVKNDLGIEVNTEKIPMNDKKTFEELSKGFTVGIFQIAGSGMTDVLKKMKPSSIYDIAIVVALYRPGPMGNIDEYIARKQKQKEVSYLHPKMEKFLKHSYGVLVFQDDLLYTAIEVAGYDWKEVDVFRKAVGKKIPELMKSQEKTFKEKAKKSGASDKQIEKIWDSFDPFKGYGFNKAHAFSYAKLACQTAYVKTHYPAQYMAAHLSSVMGEIDNISKLIFETKRMKINIFPVDVNKSYELFTTEKRNDVYGIRIGLGTIKSFGTNAAKILIEERSKFGEFKSLEDFLIRMSKYQILNKRNIEALIKVGAFDNFESRLVLLENVELLLRCLKEEKGGGGQQALLILKNLLI